MKIGVLRKVAVERLKELDADIYEECERLVTAPMSDLRLLPAVLNEVLINYEPTPENSAFILGVVYYLYAPYKLYYKNIRSDNGIRSILCHAMSWNDAPVVNHYIGIMVVYYKNPRWAAKVKELADEVYQVVNINKAEILAAYNEKNDGE